MKVKKINIDDFDYELPIDFVAQDFAQPRDNSKLMVIDTLKDEINHKIFSDIVDYFQKDDVLVLNSTKVAPNKIIGTKKNTGAISEFIIEEKVEDGYICKLKKGHPKLHNEYMFKNGLTGKIIEHENDEFIVRFNKDIKQYLDKNGELPLPVYVKKKVDQNRYQTIFFDKGESLAAPTAGLHFTDGLLKKIKNKGVKIVFVRLDISFSTFLKVTEKNIKTKKLHEEYIEINEKTCDIINSRKGNLVVCGTTSFRTLESFSDSKGILLAGKKKTNLFIYPGYRFKLRPEMVITNFHLPKSSLLMMISAYYDKNRLLEAYEQAKKNNYRFYSLGDAMLIK